MMDSLLLFAKYAIQNAGAHLTAVEMEEAVRILKHVEQLIDERRIAIAPPPEPGRISPDIDW